jgi:hypothetical protein
MGLIKSIFCAIAKVPQALANGATALATAAESAEASSSTALTRIKALEAEERLRAELQQLSMGNSSASACRAQLVALNLALAELSKIADESELKAIGEKRRKWEEEVRRSG